MTKSHNIKLSTDKFSDSQKTDYPELAIDRHFHEIEIVESALAQCPKLKGIGYLTALMQHPDERYSCFLLYHGENSPAETYKDNDALEQGTYHICEYFGCSSYDPQVELPIPCTDSETIKQIAKRYLFLETQLSEACQNHDLGRKEELMTERELIASYLRQNVNKFKRPRYETSASTKAYNNVDKALAKLLSTLLEISPEAWQICNQHLVRGVSPYWSTRRLC